jgi:hypothetical protein
MKVTKQEYYMDGILKANFDKAKTAIKQDWDMVFLYDGAEGSGKSVKAMQDAYYCDETLNIDRVTFTPPEFKKGVLNAKQYQAVIYDEAYTGLSAKATMSRINRALVSMLAEIRQKNLFVFVVMPTFFDLDKYVALWRSRALIHVYTKGFQRGYFMFYNADRKKDLYINGKKYYSYYKPECNFYGRFTNHYTVNEQIYRKKKKESLTDREKNAEESEFRQRIEDELFIRIMALPYKERDDISNRVKAKILGISESYYYIKLKKYENDELKESF